MIDGKLPSRAGALRFGAGIARWTADRRGVAAVEFALLLPILMTLYFVTMEVSLAIETSKKVSRVAAMTADLVTQQSTIVEDEIYAVMNVGEALLQPYNRTNPTITITAIQMDNSAVPRATVVWSRKLQNGARAAGAAAGTEEDVPAQLRVAGTFLVKVESELEYQPLITWAADTDKSSMGLAAAFAKLNMGDSYYLRPRMSETVPCTDC